MQQQQEQLKKQDSSSSNSCECRCDRVIWYLSGGEMWYLLGCFLLGRRACLVYQCSIWQCQGQRLYAEQLLLFHETAIPRNSSVKLEQLSCMVQTIPFKFLNPRMATLKTHFRSRAGSKLTKAVFLPHVVRFGELSLGLKFFWILTSGSGDIGARNSAQNC
jgi:hypothetical protein